jgi:iron complex transport system ATP-binding protein
VTPVPARGGAPALTARGVHVSLSGVPVLTDVDLDVHAGELLVLAGPNGAGKSTLLAVLAGDVEPAGGEVLLHGQDVRHTGSAELARRRAVMTQEHRVSFAFRVQHVVEMARAPWRRLPAEEFDDVRVASALEVADVTHLAERLYPTLSGGERARTAFARALAQDTPVLLLDEPTAALDIHHQERLLGHVRTLTAAGAAVVVVLHDLTLAAAYADRVALLAGGRVRAVGPPARVLTPALLSEVYQHPVDVLPHPSTGELLVLPRRVAAEQEARR